MSTNGVNTSEDAEMAECDSEKVVTMMDVLKEQEDFEEDANAVLGASDDKDCTYSKGYIKRQAIYACMTCCAEARNDPTKRAGVCLACSLNCHENHELVELYTKRNFRCDCGNPKFNGHPCQFTPDKTEINEENVYNQNFSGVYCICNRPYPDPEATTDQEMIQCIVCEDWLHSSHLEAVVPANEQYAEMICKACMDKNEFLHDYSDLVVNKENVDVDILNTSTELNDVKCNGSPKLETEGDVNTKANESVEQSNSDDVANDHINMEVESENVSDKAKEFEQSDDKLKPANEQENEASDDQNNSKKEETATTQDTLKSTDDIDENKEIIEKKDTEPQIATVKEPSIEENTNNDEATSNQTLEASDDVNKIQDSIENEISTQPDSHVTEESPDKPINSNEKEQASLQNVEDETVNKNVDIIENQQSAETLINKESSDVPIQSSTDEDSCVTSDKQDININEDSTHPENPEPSSSSGQETNDNKEENQTSVSDETPISFESTEKIDNRTQEQVEEDLLLRDPVEPSQGLDKVSGDTDVTSNNDGTHTSSDGAVLENKTESEAMDTSESKENTDDKENLENKPEVPEISTAKEKEEITDDTANKIDIDENRTDVEMNENTENKDTLEKDDKEQSNTDAEPSDKDATGADILKRKHSEVDNDSSTTKKPKLNDTQCVRPKQVKKIHKGATFWPANFRNKLCTCNECLSMYKDLSVLFLTDPDDTVTAYERLGQEKTNGEPLSQYEKGMAALSSLGRVQQINALTEYTKMRDKLLDFLKSFKDRKVIVKEEDIKAFFAGMKPVREPDGVYFCR